MSSYLVRFNPDGFANVVSGRRRLLHLPDPKGPTVWDRLRDAPKSEGIEVGDELLGILDPDTDTPSPSIPLEVINVSSVRISSTSMGDFALLGLTGQEGILSYRASWAKIYPDHPWETSIVQRVEFKRMPTLSEELLGILGEAISRDLEQQVMDSIGE